MSAKIYVTRHISLHTWSRWHKVLPKSWRMGNYTGHHDDNKNTSEANILCSLTFKVFQKHTFVCIKHLRPPSPKRPVAETAAPNCPKPQYYAFDWTRPKVAVGKVVVLPPNASPQAALRARRVMSASCEVTRGVGDKWVYFPALLWRIWARSKRAGSRRWRWLSAHVSLPFYYSGRLLKPIL